MRSRLILGCLLFLASSSLAQPSLYMSSGYAFSIDPEDYFRLTNQWSLKGGGGPSDPMTFFSGGSGLMLNAGLSWEFTPHFSAGVGIKLINFSMPDNYRKGEIMSLGTHFRVNFSANTRNVVPFIEVAAYVSNTQSQEQEQQTLGSQTQPAFSTKISSPIGLHFAFGLEFKLAKPLGLIIQSGVNGTMPGDEYKGADYGFYENPRDYNGGLFLSTSVGLKYYFGRGAKQRDF